MQDQIVERWETQNEAGRRFFGRGDFARAEQAFAAAIREAEQLGAADLRLATSLANLAQLKLRQKNYDEADRLFRRSLQIRESALGPDHASLVQTVNGLAAVCYARGDIDAAEPLFQRALSITERRLGAQHPDIVTSLNSLARIAFKRNDYSAAGPLLERLLVMKESTVGPDHPEAAPILGSLVKVRVAEGALDEAERLARRVVTIREAEQPPSEMTLASSLELLADVLARLGKRDEERNIRQRATTLRGHPAATAGLMPLNQRHTPDVPEDVFAPHPTPSGLRGKMEPQPPAPPALGDHAFFLPDIGASDIITPIPASTPRAPVPSPISQMPRISMDGSTDEVVPRRKTPPAAPPPLPEAPRTTEPAASVEGAGQEIVPIPAAPPPRPAPPVIAPAPVRAPAPRRSTPRQVRQEKPRPRPRPRRRRESTGPRPPRRGGRKMLVALAVLITAGAAAAAINRGGVTESRGVADAPTREFRPAPRKPRPAKTSRASVDSVAAVVRDSVALLIGTPPAPVPQAQRGPGGSQEVNVPAPLQRSDPLARQIEQMLPTTRQADPETPLPPAANLNRAGAAAEVSAASAMARIDSVTRRDVSPTFNQKKPR